MSKPKRSEDDDLLEFVGALVRVRHSLPTADQAVVADAIERARNPKHARLPRSAKPAKPH